MPDWRDYRCSFLLAVVVVSILVSPAMSGGGIGAFVIALGVVSLIAWAGYLLVGTGRWLRFYLAATAGLFGLWLLNVLFGDGFLLTVGTHSLSLLVIATTFYIVIRHALFDHDSHQVDRIIAAACGYLIIGLLWARVYEIIIYISPGAIVDGNTGGTPDNPAVLYYSLVTLTTQGYGDIAPVEPLPRLVAAMEGVVGTLYLAVVISALVGGLRPPARDRGDTR